MPLQVFQRCAACHESKDRAEFPSLTVGKRPDGRPKRVFSAYCQKCIDADPSLYNSFSAQAADAKK